MKIPDTPWHPKRWTHWLRPISREKQRLLGERWRSLPERLRTPWQAVGRHHVQCGYTLGPSYCSFGCSHCYLPSNANRVALPSLDSLRAQIDANRRLIGPGGALQITGGDVVDAYVRAGRIDELMAVTRHAVDAGLVPMLMTHGQQLLDDPALLDRLVVEGRLRKLAIHIDVTQAGRPGFPRRDLRSEADLHPLREAFVELVEGSWRRTGIRFACAHTVTVTEENFDDLDTLVRWFLADPRRTRVFRMLSLQPEAAVGRTRMSPKPVTPEAVWARATHSLGIDHPRDAGPWFGHPECSSFAPMMVLHPEGRVVELSAVDEGSRRYWAALLANFGGIGSRGHDHFDANLRRLVLLARHPGMVGETLRFLRHVLRREGLSIHEMLRRLLKGQIGFLSLVQHNFMDSTDLAEPRSATIEERLAGCCLRGAIEQDGEWVAVPMCTVNSGPREAIYAANQERTPERP